MGRGERGAVDALIGGTATARFVAELLRDGADVDGVLEFCIEALERCAELEIAEVTEPCTAAVRCLRAL